MANLLFDTLYRIYICITHWTKRIQIYIFFSHHPLGVVGQITALSMHSSMVDYLRRGVTRGCEAPSHRTSSQRKCDAISRQVSCQAPGQPCTRCVACWSCVPLWLAARQAAWGTTIWRFERRMLLVSEFHQTLTVQAKLQSPHDPLSDTDHRPSLVSSPPYSIRIP